MMSIRDPSTSAPSADGDRLPRPDERRRQPRAAFPAKALVEWGRGGDAPEVVETADFGMGGMRLASSRPVAVGQLGRVVRLLPEGTAMGVDFVVVWSFVRRLDDHADEPRERHEFGVRFLERE